MSGDPLLELNDEQRRAVECVHGPVCILAGAGSGKTTTITHRIANQVRSGEFAPENVLAVTFTTRAAGELVTRLERLGVAGVPAKTFHAAALSQLSVLGGRRLDVLPSKVRLVTEAAKTLSATHRRVQVRELAAEIERAKNLRVTPARYEDGLGGTGPLPGGPMAKVYARYEELKTRAGQVDFEDLLEQAIGMYETDSTAVERFKRRYLAFTVDEYQDVNLLQQTLLERWLDGRDELCVVGDDYQAIFGFTGASPRHLLEFPRRYPRAEVIRLERNYRSTPEVLELANGLAPRLGGRPRLLRADGSGPAPTVRACNGPEGELTLVTAAIERLHDAGVPYEEMAVLYRINARSGDYEEALHRAGIPYQVAGGGFLTRPALRSALRRLDSGSTEVVAAVERHLAQADFVAAPDPDELSLAELTRQHDLARLLELAEAYEDGQHTVRQFVTHLRDRFDGENAPGAVRLSTYHLAKGLEWDAVFLPRLEERELPFFRALESGSVAEERRLFYVGLTRARTHLFLTWDRNRKRSRFIDELEPDGASAESRVEPVAASNVPRAGAKVGAARKAEPSVKPRLRDDSWRPF